MQLHEFPAAGLGMQIVDVLRDQKIERTARLELRERAMGRVRPSRRETRPVGAAARPVVAANALAAHKIVEKDRLVPVPHAARTPIVRNARLRAATGAGQSDQFARASDESGERAHAGDCMAYTSRAAVSRPQIVARTRLPRVR